MLEFNGYRMVSSEKLAYQCQVNPAQVRKDLGYFGEFGVRGVGYDVKELKAAIKKILAINREWNMAIIGIGHLGSALLNHQNFPARDFHFVAAFDSDPEKIGSRLHSRLEILPLTELNSAVKNLEIDIGVITTPYSSAQESADRYVDAGINAIMNFTPAQITAPDHCVIEHIDFTIKLDILTYKLKDDIEFINAN